MGDEEIDYNCTGIGVFTSPKVNLKNDLPGTRKENINIPSRVGVQTHKIQWFNLDTQYLRYTFHRFVPKVILVTEQIVFICISHED